MLEGIIIFIIVSWSWIIINSYFPIVGDTAYDWLEEIKSKLNKWIEWVIK